MRLRRYAIALTFLLFSAVTVRAQTGESILVVANAANAVSVRIANEYARGRQVPDDQVLKLEEVPDTDSISRDLFHRRIQSPIARWLAVHAAFDRIFYIVLTKGIPLRIEGTAGRGGSTASVDSELALLYRRMATGANVQGGLPNPYFLGDQPISQAKPFSHESFDIFLVTRLDGYTVEDVLGVISRGRTPAKTGRFILDMRASFTPAGNMWLKTAAARLTEMGWGDRVLLDQTARVVSGERDVLGYYSWGSNDPAIKSRHLENQFVPGALGGMFVSSDGRTFREPPPSWSYGTWVDKSTHFAGSPQSLIGALIRDGITGVAGHVSEPYLDATIRPDILFPAYVAGFSLAEAFYLAMPKVGWQTVVIGDPLCSPFAVRSSLTAEQLDPPLDPDTGMPKYFNARRFAILNKPGFNAEGVKWTMRAEMLDAKEDVTGKVNALEQAIRLEPRLNSSQLLLAQQYERQRDYDKAIERYRSVLANDDRNVLALNNLAYALATRKGKADEALPFAQRAYLLTREQALTADTLAWVYHMLGDDKTALPLLREATRRVPQSGEIKWHLAAVLANLGHQEEAKRLLEASLTLNPELGSDPAVQELKNKLQPASDR
jgi:uncharacterized protein (TIGR03790 family)